MKRKRCGVCEGCTRLDCGICIFCKDKPKFGGPGRRKQCCELKKCNKSVPDISPNLTGEASKPTPTTIHHFLQSSGRKIHFIEPDGNCLFRTISYALLNTEDHHYFIRSHVVRLVNLNPDVFSQYLMPINEPTISEQVKHMICPTVWGTHLKVKAAATLFRLPIFYCTKSLHTATFSWNVVQPLPPGSIRFPTIMDEEMKEKQDINHIEMYHSQVHYDAIISTETGKVHETLPELTGRDGTEVIDLATATN